MKLSAEIIQTRVFDDFERQLNQYYTLCEDEYIKSFRLRIINEEIDAASKNYKALCREEAKIYKDKIEKDSLNFIKSYINNAFDLLDDSRREGVIDDEEANAAFSALRHILIAAEMSADNLTKLI
jgi:hypothetical protein